MRLGCDLLNLLELHSRAPRSRVFQQQRPATTTWKALFRISQTPSPLSPGTQLHARVWRDGREAWSSFRARAPSVRHYENMSFQARFKSSVGKSKRVDFARAGATPMERSDFLARMQRWIATAYLIAYQQRDLYQALEEVNRL
jgi:hypothetical protein